MNYTLTDEDASLIRTALRFYIRKTESQIEGLVRNFGDAAYTGNQSQRLTSLDELLKRMLTQEAIRSRPLRLAIEVFDITLAGNVLLKAYLQDDKGNVFYTWDSVMCNISDKIILADLNFTVDR